MTGLAHKAAGQTRATTPRTVLKPELAMDVSNRNQNVLFSMSTVIPRQDLQSHKLFIKPRCTALWKLFCSLKRDIVLQKVVEYTVCFSKFVLRDLLNELI